MKIRTAVHSDLPEILRLYEASRAFMAANGNPTQWGTTDPPKELVEEDIAAGRSYVCAGDGEILAVFMYQTGHEPLYDRLDGAWLNDLPYGVVHRMAAGGGHRGAGTFCLNWAFAQCGNLRIDTHRDNRPMQHLLHKLGFTYCGITWMEDGTERLAFQKSSAAQQTGTACPV